MIILEKNSGNENQMCLMGEKCRGTLFPLLPAFNCAIIKLLSGQKFP